MPDYMLSPVRQPRPAAILGNGPSLRGFDFARELVCYDTFGMNAAYRYWDTIDWYPTYYSCLDTVVGLHHKDAIRRLIERANEYGIKNFLLRGNLVEALGETGNHPFVHNYDALFVEDYRRFRGYWYNTGSHTTAWAALLGYRDIVLLGVTGSYIQLIEEAVPMEEEFVLQIAADPKTNPNYFFDGYQRKGDVYHLPVRQCPEFPHENQELGWHMVRPQLSACAAVVVNTTEESKVDAFPKCAFKDALELIGRLRQSALKEADDWQKALPPECAREKGAVFDTIGALTALAPEMPGLFMDIGAHHGEGSLPFLHRGWNVAAFEADTDNMAILRAALAGYDKSIFESRAASSVSGREYPWHVSTLGSAYGSMSVFMPHGEQKGTVQTITVRDFFRSREIAGVDALKATVEGFELMALRGFPFERIRPACVLCSFDDRKSIPLGSDTHDLGSFLLGMGYHVFMSEWHPIAEYTAPRQWHRFVPYPAEFEPGAAGHFFAFREPPETRRIGQIVKAHITHNVSRLADAPSICPGLSYAYAIR